MTRPEVRVEILRILGGIAPEADLDRLVADRPLREQIDMDSMDVLNFVAAIDQELHVSIPEIDYPRIATLDGCVDYVADRLGAGTAG
jgi:acyl carrier protein